MEKPRRPPFSIVVLAGSRALTVAKFDVGDCPY
jgi:hypothetical protein